MVLSSFFIQGNWGLKRMTGPMTHIENSEVVESGSQVYILPTLPRVHYKVLGGRYISATSITYLLITVDSALC